MTEKNRKSSAYTSGWVLTLPFALVVLLTAFFVIFFFNPVMEGAGGGVPFTTSSLEGNYQATLTSFILPDKSSSAVMVFQMDGVGGVVGIRTINTMGQVLRQNFTCNYQIPENGLGQMSCVFSPENLVETYDIALISGQEFYFVGTDNDRISYGKATKQR